MRNLDGDGPHNRNRRPDQGRRLECPLAGDVQIDSRIALRLQRLEQLCIPHDRRALVAALAWGVGG